MEIIENLSDWRGRYSRWNGRGDDLKGYPFVDNRRSPFTSLRRSHPLIHLALISSAGAYIDGTEPFNVNAADGDLNFREIPIEVNLEDLQFAARGYDTASVLEDLNCQIPIQRLQEYQANAVIGQLNSVWWSFSGWIPNAARMAETMIPKIVERLHRYEVQVALLVPASRLCHQSCALLARGIEASGISTMMLGVEREIIDKVHPPRCCFYDGEYGQVSGKPNWKEHQRRIMDESLRMIESFDQPTVRKLVVDLETEVEQMRGER
ncbi:MAG: glycine/sarcosine/betaine reductase selenoprotein B family protein [Acidobacteriota bacterium]|nr:glycine/sarcosine/betaine reductase selenoprotein B family protein [Acidobacteriota bacterium]